jgi:hypothetical protein
MVPISQYTHDGSYCAMSDDPDGCARSSQRPRGRETNAAHAAGNQRDLVFRRNGPRHSQLAVPQRPTLFELSLTSNTTGRIVQPPA